MASFHSNISNLLIGQGLLRSGLDTSSAITIYSGTQPSAATIGAMWTTYNSSSALFLAHYSGVVWYQGAPNTAPVMSINTFPTESTTVNTGIGTWCILWPSDLTIATMNAFTIPNTSFIVGAVSTLSGVGTIRFNANVNFTAGVVKPILDGVITGSST